MISRHDRRPSSDFLLASAIVACLTCDFVMAPALVIVPARPTVGVPILLSIVGCVFAQGCLLAAWMAWSDQPFWRRFTRHWTIVAILYVVWAAGLFASHPGEFARVSSFVGLSVPLVSIAAQTPPWIARMLFGWRLIRGDPSTDVGPAPLAIRDLMAATLMVALALALARLAPSPDGKEMGGIWIFMFVVPSAISMIALAPASALLLRTRPFQLGMRYASLYAAFWLGLPWLAVFVGLGTGLFPVPPLAIVLGASCLIISFAATVVFAAAAARSHGYRLAWGVSRRLPRRD